jgi:hypothetical protein
MSALSASASTGSQVPLWVLVFSITAAPILGFIGVGVGAFLTERNRRSAYLAEEKKKVYVEFIDMLANLNAFWSNEFPAYMRNVKSAEAAKVLGFSKPQIEALHRAVMQIKLFGSQAVYDAGSSAFVFELQASMTSMAQIAGGFDRRQWNEVVNAGIKVMADFSDAARKDLGLPDLAYNTSDPDPDAKFAEIETVLLKFLEDRMSEIKKNGADRQQASKTKKSGEESSQA